MNPIPCSLCQKDGHSASRCPELCAPLKPGFFQTSGGGSHSHDDDDEKMKRLEPNVCYLHLDLIRMTFCHSEEENTMHRSNCSS